jgi:hypothetical protein
MNKTKYEEKHALAYYIFLANNEGKLVVVMFLFQGKATVKINTISIFFVIFFNLNKLVHFSSGLAPLYFRP